MERESKRGLLHAARNAAVALSDIFLPRFCIVCGTKLTLDESHICAGCAGDIPLTRYWDMEYNPAADRFNELIQLKYETGSPAYEPYSRYAGLFFFSSGNGYRHICYGLKYRGNIPMGRHFSNELGRRLAESELFKDVDLVVPVPLHWTRHWKRGYNQAAVIAKAVASQLGARHSPRLLRRLRRTQTQTVLSIEQKKLNVAGAFAVNPRFFARHFSAEAKPRHILLIDDVMTTGATLAACHTALREAFPPGVRISAATLACIQR